MPADPRPTQPLPAQPSLEQQKKRARELLNAARSGDQDARRRLTAVGAKTPSLHVAQLAIAREYGFSSWPKLKAHIDSLTAQRNFERYEPIARRAWFFARYEAAERGSPVIEPEHLLLALLRDGGSSIAAMLRELKLPVDAIKEALHARATSRPKVPEPVEIPFGVGSRRMLHAAAEEADRLSSDRIGCDHLLLGMLRHSESLAATILHEHGARLDTVRAAAVQLTPMTPVGATSRWVAASRALESERATPLFSDPWARPLAGEQGFAMLTSFRTGFSPGSAAAPDPYFSIRTKYLDDAILAAVFESSITQAVILAAGMDTRALRLAWPAGMRVFEIDRDDVFNQKEAVLERLNARPACDRRVLRLDLAGQWTEPLIAAGLDPGRPAAVLVEGLLPYLDEVTVRRLFSSIGTIACEGSWLGLDTVNDEMLVSPFMTVYLKKLAEFGCPWGFGVRDPLTFLSEYGWEGTKVQPGDPEANYGRWTYGVAPGASPGIPRTFLVQARKIAP